MALNVIHGPAKGGRYPINSGKTAPLGLTGSAAFDPNWTKLFDTGLMAVRNRLSMGVLTRGDTLLEVRAGIRWSKTWAASSDAS
jgi:hypothetical protein